ncbi:MAG: metal dependent phosphohydrolase [Proteobacteria bacterium]|nr:metal dependent phosphohydrolase [Pseudomonadota bacterium]
MDSHPTHVVKPEELCIGLHIHLDLPWISHPFPFPSFKINSPEQIATIRGLGLKAIRYSPAKSDCQPLIVLPRDDTATRAVAEAAPRVADDPADQAKQARIKRLAAQREKIAACEREFLNTTRQMKAVRQNLFSRPDQVCEQATDAVAKLADSMLVNAELSIHLMSDKVAGDDVFNHALNVCLLSMMVGKEMQLPAAQVKLLGLGALLHDLGQAEIPGHIKNKTTALTRPEAALMRQHCAMGVTLGKQLGLPGEALLIIAQHHEHLDGTGYPRMLHEPQLSRLARIVAVVETYEELCSPRNPARACTPHEALSQLYGQQKKQLDETVVTSFIRCLSVYPPGTIVLLSNGALGVVTSVSSAHLLKPTVMVYDAAVASGETILVDLEQESDVTIAKTIRPQQLPPEVGQFFSARKRISYYFSSEAAVD